MIYPFMNKGINLLFWSKLVRRQASGVRQVRHQASSSSSTPMLPFSHSPLIYWRVEISPGVYRPDLSEKEYFHRG